MWNIDFNGDIAVECPCFLILDSNGWADFLSNPVLAFTDLESLDVSGIIGKFNVYVNLAIVPRTKHINRAF